MNDTRISTNILNANGTRAIGTKASDEVIETVLKHGKEFTGETIDVEKKCITRYMPLFDSTGKAVGMWFTGVDKKFISDQITDLRKPITQISIIAIIIAFMSFLFLSRRMVYDVDNFDIKLSA
jgi:sensor histidine kinase regulating citrate/malate metabolism